MKIIYLHQYFNSPDMAGGTRSYEMAQRLVKMGHEVHIVTSQRENNGNHDCFFYSPFRGQMAKEFFYWENYCHQVC